MPKKGGKRKKTHTHVVPNLQQEAIENKGKEIPRTVVARVGKTNPNVRDLVQDFRKIMEPYTASNLRERSYNKIKDFTSVAGHLGLSHILAFSQTENNIILRIGRFPNGPTVHFKVLNYSLADQVRGIQKKPYNSVIAYHFPPLVVLNNFSAMNGTATSASASSTDSNKMELIGITLQHMFPTIDVKTVNISECRRVVLFNYIPETDTIDMRHYAVRAAPVGVSKTVKRLMQSKTPDLGDLADISEFMTCGGGYGGASDSEAEDETVKVVLPDRFTGHGNSAAQQSALKLVELGPRLSLEAFKVERGVAEGDILYHKYESKTPAEAAAIKRHIEQQQLLKLKRRQEQEANVSRKKEQVEAKQKAKVDRKRRRLEGKSEFEGDGGLLWETVCGAEDVDDDDED